MKQKIRINESQLRNIIAESVKKVLEENSWRGCPNIQMINHGEWSDPELEADGCIANYWDVENYFWSIFLEESEWNDSDSGNPKCEDEFNRWLQANESDVISVICDYSSEN